jgi:hypothetical protein
VGPNQTNMNTLKPIAEFVGENGDQLRQKDVLSQQKIVNMALSLAIPVLLWLVQGALLASIVLGYSPLESFEVGVGCALIVYLVDRVILMSSTVNRSLIGARVLLALSIAVVGGICMDLAIYNGDINAKIDKMYYQQLDSLDHSLARTEALDEQKLIQTVKDKQANLDEKQRQYLTEIQVLRPGTGPISAAIRDELMRPAKHDLAEAENALNQYRKDRDKRKMENRKLAKRENGFALRLDLLHGTVFRTWFSTALFIFISLIFFMLELIVLSIKLGSQKTALDIEREQKERRRKESSVGW